MKRRISKIDDRTWMIRDDTTVVLNEIALQGINLGGEITNENCAHLAIADPPYNLGQRYSGFTDRWHSKREYWEWCEWWLRSLAKCVTASGSIWVLTPPETSARLYVYAEDALKLKCQEIPWYYRFGQHTRRRFIPAHTNWLWITNPRAKYLSWHPERIAVNSDRLAKYDDKRVKESPWRGKRVPFDVWDEFPRIQGNNRERQKGSPNQIPEAMVRRIIEACTNRNHLIIDVFAGTGTVGTIARSLGRKSLSIEVAPETARKAIARIKRGPTPVDS